jgi:hypothetical protein
LRGFQPPPGARHDREHLLMHLTCAILPVCRQFAVPRCAAADGPPPRRVFATWIFSAPGWMPAISAARGSRATISCSSASCWFICATQAAIRAPRRRWPSGSTGWNGNLDPRTSLWGTDGACGPAEAVYGGYHQLLIYHYERRPVRNPHGLIDGCWLSSTPTGASCLRERRGVRGRGCRGHFGDLYKQTDHRRREVRMALRKCADHVWAQQNPDGGFPYTRNRPQHHMGVPGTVAPPNVSAMFPTWFRIHTLAVDGRSPDG